MGRRRKTTDELERRGAFDKNPDRLRARANTPFVSSALGAPPPEFLHAQSPTSVELLKCWNEIVEAAKEVRLTSADRIHVEMTARQMYKCRRPGARSSDYGQLDRFLGKLGLNPADRSRVEGTAGHRQIEDEPGDDEWQELAEQGAAAIQ